jgi:hypothetical protein
MKQMANREWRMANCERRRAASGEQRAVNENSEWRIAKDGEQRVASSEQ